MVSEAVNVQYNYYYYCFYDWIVPVLLTLKYQLN